MALAIWLWLIVPRGWGKANLLDITEGLVEPVVIGGMATALPTIVLIRTLFALARLRR